MIGPRRVNQPTNHISQNTRTNQRARSQQDDKTRVELATQDGRNQRQR